MFRSYQIISPHKLIKNFGNMVRELSVKPQAVLIIPKRRDKLVLVNANIFEDLLEFRHSAQLSSESTQHLQSALTS